MTFSNTWISNSIASKIKEWSLKNFSLYFCHGFHLNCSWTTVLGIWCLLFYKTDLNWTTFTSNSYQFPKRKIQNSPTRLYKYHAYSLMVMRIWRKVNHSLVTDWARSGHLKGYLKPKIGHCWVCKKAVNNRDVFIWGHPLWNGEYNDSQNLRHNCMDQKIL